MTQIDCHSEAVCWRHDLDRYRYMTNGITAAFQAVAAALLIAGLCLSPDNGAPGDAADLDSPESSSNRVTDIAVGGNNSGEQRRTPVGPTPPVGLCNDVRPAGASDVTPELTNIAAGGQSSQERYGSVDTSV